MADHYADGTCSWWHLSQPPPELVAAIGDGWLHGGGRVLDVGCGLGTEAGYLASAGWQAAGIDLSGAALAQAAAGHQEAAFLRADVRRLLLRASLRAAGERNDIDEAVIARTFGAWRVEDMERAEVPSDTRMLEVIVARLSAPAPPFPAGDARFPGSGPRFPAGTM